MKFFIPYAKNDEDAEEVYSGIIKNNNAIQTDNRIFKLSFYDNNKRIFAEVGKPIVGNNKTGDQIVIAIVEKFGFYCICFPTMGVFGGVPVYVDSKPDNAVVEYFD